MLPDAQAMSNEVDAIKAEQQAADAGAGADEVNAVAVATGAWQQSKPQHELIPAAESPSAASQQVPLSS